MNYKTWIFDCDGVILDSNQIKSDAFYEVTKSYGSPYVDDFVDYNKMHNGISRFEKISFFYANILKTSYTNEDVHRLANEYGELCLNGIKKCDETPGVKKLLLSLSGAKKFVVSGGKEDELIEIFQHKNLDKYFNGIYGCPATKEEILQRIEIIHPCVFIGDSKYDYLASQIIGANFIFMSGFTQWNGWKEFFQDKEVRIIQDLQEVR